MLNAGKETVVLAEWVGCDSIQHIAVIAYKPSLSLTNASSMRGCCHRRKTVVASLKTLVFEEAGIYQCLPVGAIAVLISNCCQTVEAL
jgi:hypothetical protein